MRVHSFQESERHLIIFYNCIPLSLLIVIKSYEDLHLQLAFKSVPTHWGFYAFILTASKIMWPLKPFDLNSYIEILYTAM